MTDSKMSKILVEIVVIFVCLSAIAKKACVLQRKDGCREGLQNSCLCVGSPGIMRTWGKFALQLTSYISNKTKYNRHNLELSHTFVNYYF
jgi:hypothetical protein